MAEPSISLLRSPIAFAAGKRETILDEWQQSLEKNKVNIRYNAAAVKIESQQGDYVITLANVVCFPHASDCE
jgi:predicted flavoprotein YhiN